MFVLGALLISGYSLVQWRLGNINVASLLGGPTRTPVASATATRDPQTVVDEGDTIYRTGDFRKAIAVYEQALRRKPNDAPLIFKIARLQTFVGQPDKAEQRLLRALQLETVNTNIALLRAGLCMSLDWQSRVADAIKECNTALELDKNNASASAYLAEALADNGEFRPARAAAQRALDLAPRDPDALRNMGYTYELQGRYPEAISYYGEAIDAVGGLPHVYLAIGRSYYAQGLLDKAILYYQKALEKDPAYVEVYERLGTAYNTLREPQPADAIVWFKKGIALDPKRYTLYTGRARSNFLRKDYEGSIVDFTTAISVSAQVGKTISPLDYIYLGFANEQTNQCSAAITAWDTAVTISKKDPDILDQVQVGYKRCRK